MAQVSEGKYAPLKTKLLWTALFFACFLIGRNIPVPLLHNVATGTSSRNADLLNAANIATAGNFFSPSLFSLGLGPWMGAAILWRFLLIGKIASDREIPKQTMDRARNAVMVTLAVIQAISLMSHYQVGSLPWGPFSDRVNAQIVIVAFLTAGAILVAWLAKQNEERGLGGVTMFILYQIIISIVRNTEVLTGQTGNAHYVRVLWPVILACVCVVVIGVFAGNAELRLHINKVSIDSGFTGVSYLPIKLNPAGASPIMYSLALLAIPLYIAHAVRVLFPGAAGGINQFLSDWQLSTPLGFTFYLVLLYGMTIFIGLLTVSPKDVAKRMKDRGEYFDHVLPGRATRRYLQIRVVGLSAVSGVFLVLLTGLPLHFIGQFPGLQYLLMAPGTVIIVMSLLWSLQEEIADTLLGTKYDFTLKAPSTKAPSTKAPSPRVPAPRAPSSKAPSTKAIA